MSSPSRITPDRAVLVGAVLALLAYIQDLRYDFILDDVPLIALNDSILSWRDWKWAFLRDISAMKGPTMPLAFTAIHYRPVYKLWHLLNVQLFGFIVPWWHLSSLLLHFGVIFLVYQLGVELMKDRWAAALAALLFAYHPIHVESVAYITASSDILLTLFALLSFLAYFRFREEGPSPLYFIASVFAAALAMMSKETAVIFPWLLVAYEALREPRPGIKQDWKRFAWTVPFFAVVAAYVAVRTLLFGPNAGPGPGTSRLAALLDVPLVLVVYLHNLLWPFRLSFFYPAEWSSQWTLLKGVAAVMAMGAAFFLWQSYRDRRGVRLQILWAAILFVPAVLGVSVFVREDWVHDRHMYLASVPVCLIAAAFLTDPRWPRKASVVVSSAILAILLVTTAFQVPKFSDNVTIYASALKVAPHSYLLHSFYAGGLMSYGKTEEGLREYKLCTEMAPKSSSAYEHYASALAHIGRSEEAMAEYEKALEWSPGPTAVRAHLLSEIAELELQRSEFPAAADHLREAVQLAPQALTYHSLFSQALRSLGRTQEADEEKRLEAEIQQRYFQDMRASRN
jgi:tetratricopeptide (TPR) repeat protein